MDGFKKSCRLFNANPEKDGLLTRRLIREYYYFGVLRMCFSGPSERLANAIRYGILFPLARNGAIFTEGKILADFKKMDDKQIIEYGTKLLNDPSFWETNSVKIKKFEEEIDQKSTFGFLEQKLKNHDLNVGP